MALVVVFPKSGVPEESSKTEPTAAIALIQAPNKNTPLLGVTMVIPPKLSKSKLVLGDARGCNSFDSLESESLLFELFC